MPAAKTDDVDKKVVKNDEDNFKFRKIDLVWCALGSIVFIFATFIFSKVNNVHAVQRNVDRYDYKLFVREDGTTVESKQELQSMFDNYRWPAYLDLWVTVASALGIFIVQGIFEKIFFSTVYSWMKDKGDSKLKNVRAGKAITHLAKSFYFLSATIAGTIVLQNSSFVPNLLKLPFLEYQASSGQHNSFHNYPLVPYSDNLRIVYLGTMGYHVMKTMEQLFLDPIRNDFVEMMLHHVITLTLYSSSYLINSMEIGILVVYCHDWADVFGHFVKFSVETHFEMIQPFGGISTWASWLISRLVIFPIVCSKGLMVPYEKVSVWAGSDEALLSNILGAFCLVLLLLNTWWFYLISYMLYRFVRYGKAEDIQKIVKSQKKQN